MTALSLSLSLYIYIYIYMYVCILISTYCWISRLFLFSPLNRNTALAFPFSLSSLILFLPLFLPLLFPILLLILELGWPHPAFREADWQGKEGPHGGPCGASPWAVEADRGVGVTHGGLGGSVPSESCPHFWLIPSYDLNGFVLSQSNRV